MTSTAIALGALALSLGATPAVVIEHDGPTATSDGGVALEARMVSSAKRRVFEPAAFVRAPGATDYQRLPMAALTGDHFRVTLPAALASSGCEYFLEAFDEDGNGPFREGAPEQPLRLSPTQPPARKQAPAAAAAQSAPPGRPRRTAGIVLVATGGALLIGGAVSGILALTDYNAEKGAATPAAWDKARSSSKAESVAADALYGAGAAVALVGAILWATDRAPPAAVNVSLAASPAPGGACAVVSGRF